MNLIRFNQIVVVFALSVATTGFLVEATSDRDWSFDNESDERLPSLTFREHFKLTKLFSFEYFKSLFKRHYNFVEEVVRRKLYLGRAFRAFVSAVNYKYKKVSYYLAINHMSDWTPDEVRQMYIENYGFGDKNSNTQEDSIKVMSEKISKANVEGEFGEIGHMELRNQLTNSKSNTDLRDTSMGSLLREHQPNDIVALDLDKSVPETTGWLDLWDTKANDENSGQIFSNFLKEATRGTFFNQLTEAKGKNSSPDLVFVDHRDSPCYQAPRSQGKCGSCYAFATLALYEWLFCQKTGKLIQFSEQYVVDCGDRIGMTGCKGAQFTEVSRFVQQFGLEIRGNYPYVGGDYKCPFKPEEPTDIMGYIRVQNEGFTAVPLVFIGSHLDQNPFVMNIRVNRDFSEYGGGVDKMDFWQEFNVLHSVLVVGSGREDGDTYWLIRNSLSENWGERGHYKLNKKTTCIYSEKGFVLNAKFKPTLEENLNEKYDGNRVTQALIDHPTIWNGIEKSLA